MRKTNNKIGIRQLHTVYQEHAEMLIKLVEGPHGFGSGSDVVRKAIVEIYNKFYPPYKGPTYKQKKEEDEQEEFASLSDLDFATEKLNAKIVQKKDGGVMAMIHWYGNSAEVLPIEGIKEWATVHEADVKNHLDTMKVKTIDEILDSVSIRQAYERQYGIILE